MSHVPEGLSGEDAARLEKHKHAADSDTLQAISAVYAGKAKVELIDVDRLFNADKNDRDKEPDYKQLREAADDFTTAEELYRRAANACREVLSLAPTGERELLELDIKTFFTLSDGFQQLATQMRRGKLPPNSQIHPLMAILRDQDVIAERRAVAYQGLRGHLPKGY